MNSLPDWIANLAVIVPVLLASAIVGWPITALVLRSARVPEPPRVNISGDARTPVMQRRSEVDVPQREVLRGGMWIGILERIALTAAIMSGRFELAAVVVAIKALGRYPEIRENPAVSERFIIGTLTSLLVAGLFGAIGRTLLTALSL